MTHTLRPPSTQQWRHVNKPIYYTNCDWHLPFRNICLVRFTLSGFIRYLDPAVVPFEFRLQA